MAFTGTTIAKDVWGATRVAVISCTADALSGAVVAGGMGVIYGASLLPISMATAGITINLNKNAAGTAANGSLHLSGCVSGDAFFLTVYGRS